MTSASILRFTVLYLFTFHFSSCAVLERYINDVSSCEVQCEQKFTESLKELRKACSEGCRLYTVINLAKDLHDSNETVTQCKFACSEAYKPAYMNETVTSACNFGCTAYPVTKDKDMEEDIQTLHLLTPLIYVRSAYNSMAHHMRQFISTSWTLYVQEDSGNMVVLQTSPKVMESLEYTVSKDDGMGVKDYQQSWQEAKLDWMDCISHQSGIPRWILVAVLFGFIFALLWLCCATAVTAPSQYVASKKKKMSGYILVCEPENLKSPIVPLVDCNSDEAPPLPQKVSLI